MFNRISHIGIAVKDIDAAIALYEGMGVRLLARRTAKNGTTSLVMLDLGGGFDRTDFSPQRRHASRPVHSGARRRLAPRCL